MHQRDLTERLLRLRSVPVLRGMTSAELAPLAASLVPRTFEKGDYLLREDEPPRSLHLLLTGAVVLRRHGKVIRRVDAPGGVGFLSLLARNAGGTEVVAETTCQTLELRGDALDEVFEDHFHVLLGTMRWVTERLIADNIDQPPPPFKPPDDAFDKLIGDRELGIVERIFLLRRTEAFKNANVNSTARLARRMKEVRLPAGEVVWRPGDKADSTLFVVSGMLRTSWKNSRGEPMTQDLGPGYIIGGAEAIANCPRWNELVTLEPARFLHGSSEGLIDMFEDDCEVALKFLSMIATFLLTVWDRKAEAEAASSRAMAPSLAP